MSAPSTSQCPIDINDESDCNCDEEDDIDFVADNELKENQQNRFTYDYLAITADRYRVSCRAVAAIVSAALKDMGILVCNFVCHDKCMKVVVSPCSSVAPTLVKTPVAHCWSEPAHHRRKFCNVCRKRLDDTWTIRCEVCEYYVHVECSDFSVANCKDSATFNPQQTLESVEQKHHWREGNLPQNSKCAADKKTCWAAECLAGLRCEWCGTTAHVGCVDKISPRCTFGVLEPILLPPSAVSIPRTEVPMEAIIGLSVRRKDTWSPRSISEEFSSGDFKAKEAAEDAPKEKSKEKEEKDEEAVKVYDGNSSLRRRMFRLISLPRAATSKEFLHAAARAFHVPQEAHRCYLTDAYSDTEEEVVDPLPLSKLTRREGKRPAVFLRFREKDNLEGLVNVYLGKVGRRVEKDKTELPVTSETHVSDVIKTSLCAFGLHDENPDEFRLVEVILDKGVSERIMEINEQPWERLKAVARDSIRQMEMTRFYLQQKKDPHGTSIALFVGNLPPNLSQRQYETILTDILGKGYKFSSIGPIYYEYGSMVLTYEDTDTGIRAFYTLRESSYDEKALLVMLLPNVFPEMVAEGVQPLLVFVNVKSGGCQGLELVSSFRKLLNPYQVFDLENGGPLPGLYVFRNMKDYKILVCGGDGTIGWVLQCLDNVGQDSECSSPPCAIVPLGTGNDLARVLRWGPGYNGGEDPLNLLKDVIEAEEIRLDRWTVVFRMEDKADDKAVMPNSDADFSSLRTAAAATSEENTQIFVMNNYFGIGIEAELCLDFHNAREENPNKFNSRLHNKGVYVKMGLRKMVSRKLCKDLHKEIRLEVDGKVVELPPLEGIVILNILSWGSGANPWGLEKDDHFSKPNHWDGMLEVVGVTGVVHLGQIQSGLRSAMRIAQGGHIRIKLNSEIPIQVDGEPWIQAPGEVVVLKSALKATMLKKTTRSRLHRRNTEPFATRPAPVFKEKTQA